MHELKQAVDEATSVTVVLHKKASDKDYLSALQVQRMAPEKIQIIAPPEKELAWQNIFNIPQQKKEFAITINTAISPVEELRYEKDGEHLTIFLSHTKSFETSALSFGEHLPPADLIITVGFTDDASALRTVESIPRKGAARHIALEETNGDHRTKKIAPPEAALLGRLMVRSRNDTDLDVLWSFITREDFEKTASSPEHIPQYMELLTKIVSLPRVAAIFWQFGEDAGTEGMLWSEDDTLIKRALLEPGTIQADGHIVRLPKYENFIDAETSVRKLLRTLA